VKAPSAQFLSRLRALQVADDLGEREREHDKLDVRRKRSSRAWSDEGQVRATVPGKRGRDGLKLRGTAGGATSRKQTHGVGNQAMSESQNKLTAWRNQAVRASWEEGVERETERQTRRDKLMRRATEA
jgi:hypothetical protein